MNQQTSTSMAAASVHFQSDAGRVKIMHAVNNTLVFTLIAAETTAMPVPTLLVDTAPHTAEVMLLTTTILYVPVVVYMILDARKKKKAAQTC